MARNVLANGQAINIDNASIVGNYNTIIGNCNTITGNSNNVTGDYLQIFGNRNAVKGVNVRVIGNGNVVDGNNNTITGNNNEVYGMNPIIQGCENSLNGQAIVPMQSFGSPSGNFQFSQSISYSNGDNTPTFEFTFSNMDNNFGVNYNNNSYHVNTPPRATTNQNRNINQNPVNVPNMNIKFITENMLANDVSEDYEKYSCKICCERMKKLSLSGCKHSFCFRCVYNIQNPHNAQILCPYCKQLSYSFHEIYLDD